MSRISALRRLLRLEAIATPPGSVEYRLASLDPIMRARYDAWGKFTERAHESYSARGENSFEAMLDDPTAFPRMPKELEYTLWPEQRAVDREIAIAEEHAAAGRTEAAELAMARAYTLMIQGDRE